MNAHRYSIHIHEGHALTLQVNTPEWLNSHAKPQHEGAKSAAANSDDYLMF